MALRDPDWILPRTVTKWAHVFGQRKFKITVESHYCSAETYVTDEKHFCDITELNSVVQQDISSLLPYSKIVMTMLLWTYGKHMNVCLLDYIEIDDLFLG